MLRIEYRHDRAAADMFFDGEVAGDGTTTAYVPNSRYQYTLALGLAGSFSRGVGETTP